MKYGDKSVFKSWFELFFLILFSLKLNLLRWFNTLKTDFVTIVFFIIQVIFWIIGACFLITNMSKIFYYIFVYENADNEILFNYYYAYTFRQFHCKSVIK